MSDWANQDGARGDNGAGINAAVNPREPKLPSGPTSPLKQGDRVETVPLVNKEV